MDFLESAFWTAHGKKDSSQDPLGLDFMREQLSDILVPNLTGRTVSLVDVFWTLIFLYWSSYTTDIDDEIVKNFLFWERCLKLTWAKYPELCDRESFDGIERARIQKDEPGAPKKRYVKLLANARTQGMLGAYLRPLRKLGLVNPAKITVSEKARPWIEFAGMPKDPQDGSWKSFKATFTSLYDSNHKSFDKKFHENIRESMPDLYHAFSNLGWTDKESWDRATGDLGSLGVYARLAHEFRKWSAQVRDEFNKLVFGGAVSISNWPVMDFSVPAELNDRRWNFVRTLAGQTSVSVRVLIDWHQREFDDRRKDAAELWIDFVDGKMTKRPYIGSNSSTWNSDCRWRNAVVMMKPPR